MRATVLLLSTLLPASEALFKSPVAAPKPGVAGMRGRVVPTRSNKLTPPVGDAPPELVQNAIDVGITAMRLGTCALMVHHGTSEHRLVRLKRPSNTTINTASPSVLCCAHRL